MTEITSLKKLKRVLLNKIKNYNLDGGLLQWTDVLEALAKFRKSLEESEKELQCNTDTSFSEKDSAQIEGYNNGLKAFRRRLLE